MYVGPRKQAIEFLLKSGTTYLSRSKPDIILYLKISFVFEREKLMLEMSHRKRCICIG